MTKPSATVFIVNCGNSLLHDPEKSLEGLDEVFDIQRTEVIDGGTKFGWLDVETEWKVFVYSDEFWSKSLLATLPFYLSRNFDILVLYKHKEGVDSVFLCPRIFRRQVLLNNKALVPVRYEGFNHTRILDGFLMGRTA